MSNPYRLDYLIEQDAFEPVAYYTSTGDLINWQAANIRDGGSDISELFQASPDGNIFKAETGLTDYGVAIKIRFLTKKFPLGAIGLLQQVFVRLAAVTDSITVTINTGGSEYGEVSKSYTINLANPENTNTDKEIKVKLERELLGRWAQVQITGDVNNRPAIREMILWYIPHRVARVSL